MDKLQPWNAPGGDGRESPVYAEIPQTPVYCGSQAHAARLSAIHPRHRSNADVWTYISRAWINLAELKERVAKYQPGPFR
jgi:hypothetical protein